MSAREFTRRRLAERDGARASELSHDAAVVERPVPLIESRAHLGGHSGNVDDVLHAKWNAGQRLFRTIRLEREILRLIPNSDPCAYGAITIGNAGQAAANNIRSVESPLSDTLDEVCEA